MTHPGGRPSFEPSADQRFLVTIMVACGFRQELIAEKLGIDRKTLRKTCRTELKVGKDQANAIVAQSLFKKATSNGPQSVTAAIFWLKTQAGWKETDVHEHTGKDGAPLAPPIFNIGFGNGGPGDEPTTSAKDS